MGIPKEVEPYLSGAVYLWKKPQSKEKDSEEILREIIKFLIQNQELVMQRWIKLCKSSRFADNVSNNLGTTVLYFALETLQIIIEKYFHTWVEKATVAEQTKAVLTAMLKEFDLCSGETFLVEAFLREFYKQSDTAEGILNRLNVSIDQVKYLGRWPMYDEKFYYIPPDFFDQICSRLAEFSGKTRIKNVLQKQGVIAVEGRNRTYYSMKRNAITDRGAVDAGRFIRLVRNKIDQIGMLTWQEKIEMKGGDRCEQNRTLSGTRKRLPKMHNNS